jgi:NADH-quinone oxidoreductase subunit C
MLQKDFIAKIGQEFGLDPAHIKAVAEKKLAINVDNGEALSFLIYLKNIDFIQLSLITAVDWIDENRFELVYTLVSWEKNLTVSVSTFIPRDNPVIVSVRHIWPTAKYYEWDINEFFGIIFSGHPVENKGRVIE